MPDDYDSNLMSTLPIDTYEGEHAHDRRDRVSEHPCYELKKLLGGGSFYYSGDFDLASRLQDRSVTALQRSWDSAEGEYDIDQPITRPRA